MFNVNDMSSFSQGHIILDAKYCKWFDNFKAHATWHDVQNAIHVGWIGFNNTMLC